jgi:hypothetical protein
LQRGSMSLPSAVASQKVLVSTLICGGGAGNVF